MAGLMVADVKVGALDSAGSLIETIYVKNAPDYAIYGTANRVLVHFADNPEQKAAQQQLLAALNPIRSEIHSLIDGWRAATTSDEVALTRMYDRRIADGLAAALEGNAATAQALLRGALDGIAEERQSRGRAEHLRFALYTVAVTAVVAGLAYLIGGSDSAGAANALNVLAFAAAAGAVGAFVSISIKVQDRSLTTDLQSRDNILDAILRVSVGAIGAVLLLAMFRSALIDVEFGSVDLGPKTGAVSGVAPPEQDRERAGDATDATEPSAPAVADAPSSVSDNSTASAPASPDNTQVISPPAEDTNTTAPDVNADQGGGDETERTAVIVDRGTADWLVILVIAFFAGFTERLVSRLADRFRFRDVAAQAAAGAGSLRDAEVTRSGAQLSRTGPAGANTQDGDDDPGEDGCVAHDELADEDLTDDVELPETTGGVAEGSPR